MRLHSDTLTYDNLYNAAQHASRVSGGTVHITRAAAYGSRSRQGAWDVSLEGDGTLSHRRVNFGTAKNVDRFDRPYAATYDQWGHFLAYLFAVDPRMVTRDYDGLADFHAKTSNAYWLSPLNVPTEI